MGISINAQTTDADFVYWVNKSMEICFNRMLVVWYHIDFIYNMTSDAEEFRECCTKVRSFTRNVVKQKRLQYQHRMQDSSEAQLDEVPQKKNSFLQQFIELSEKGEYLTDTEILDEVLIIMIGASETTASIDSLTLIMLGMYPEIQEKVYMEVIDAIGNDKPVEYTDLPKLQYLEMVIKETMRIFPVGPMIGRTVTGDINLDENTVIPAGCSVIIGTIHAHRDPKVWPEPMKFDPMRFLPEECAKRHPYSYIPFSGGPRNCIGLKYAMMAMKAVIATIVRKYHIESCYDKIEDIKIKQDLVLKLVDGYGISIEARN